jgi:hypothetical protein
MLTWVAVPLGLFLIGLALLDVFLTVLHIQVESPISNEVNRRFWRVVVFVSRRLPEHTRDSVLGWGAPLMIGGIVVFWAALYILGFALLYVPFIQHDAVFTRTDIGPRSPFGDALYFSAISFLTTGYGDILPIHPIARSLAVLQGGLGLFTLSLSVTYLLSVFPLISRKVSLAETLNQETAGCSDAVAMARRYVPGGRYEALAQRLSGINDELIKLGQSHGLYPVLYYVRPHEVHHSFVRVLAIVQGIIATLRYGLDADEYPDIVHDPRLLILEEGLLSTLHMLAASSHLGPEGAVPEDGERARRNFRALTEALRNAGLVAASPDDARASARHTRFRSATDHYVRAYAQNSAYDITAVYASYSRWERDTALIGHAELDDDSVDTSTADDAADDAGASTADDTTEANVPVAQSERQGTSTAS